MLQIDPSPVAAAVGEVDGEVRAVLPVFRIDGAHFIGSLVAEADAVPSEEVAYAALLVALAEDRTPVHILVVGLHAVFHAGPDVLLLGVELELVGHPVAAIEDIVGDGLLEFRAVVHQVVVDHCAEIAPGDGRLLSGCLRDDIEGELVEGDAGEVLLSKPLGEGFRRLTSEGYEEDPRRVNALPVYEIAYLPDRGHRLSAARAGYHQHVVLEGHDGFTLLVIEGILHHMVEEVGVGLQLPLDEVTVVLRLYLLGLC